MFLFLTIIAFLASSLGLISGFAPKVIFISIILVPVLGWDFASSNPSPLVSFFSYRPLDLRYDDLSGQVRGTGSYLVSNPTSPEWLRNV